MTEKPQKTRVPVALTHRGIDSLRAEVEAYRVPDLRCPGLAVRVAASGVKTWDLGFRVRGAGKVRRVSLGPFPAVSLDAARERANELTRAAKAGRDLLSEEAAAKAVEASRPTVSQVIDAYVRRAVKGKLRTAGEIEMRLRRALAPVANKHADEVRRRDIRDILDAAADRGVLREAEKQRQSIGTMFRWAVGQDLIAIDPTHGLAPYSTGMRRERSLTPEEIKTLWDWLPTSGMPEEYTLILRLQLALGTRVGEVAGMAASEVNTDNWLWTLPAQRSKNGRPRVTPLVGIARTMITDRLRTISAGPLFMTETGLPMTSGNVASMLVKRRKLLPIDHFVSHDLRRTVATGMVDLGISFETVAAVIGHEVGGQSVRILSRHYVRTDLIEHKRAALEAWDAHLGRIIAGSVPASNVTTLARSIREATIIFDR